MTNSKEPVEHPELGSIWVCQAGCATSPYFVVAKVETLGGTGGRYIVHLVPVLIWHEMNADRISIPRMRIEPGAEPMATSDRHFHTVWKPFRIGPPPEIEDPRPTRYAMISTGVVADESCCDPSVSE